MFKVNPVAELEFAEDGHTYTLDGKLIPGVTTITGNMSKPYLVPWAAKMVAETALNLIKPNTPYSKLELEKLMLTAKQAPNKRKEGAADKGKIAHKWIEHFIKSEIDIRNGREWAGMDTFPLLKDLAPEVVNSIKGFNEWREQYNPRWIQSELLVCSRKYEYAGTLDAVAEIGGKICILDFKSGKSIPDEIALQLAGYIQALSEMGGEIEGRAVLHIPALAGAKWEYRVVDEPVEFALQTFLSLRQVQKWVSFQKNNKEAR